MTDDDLLADYLGASTEEEREAAAHHLAERGIDASDFDVIFETLADEAQWLEPDANLVDRIMADVLADVAPNSATTTPIRSVGPGTVTAITETAPVRSGSVDLGPGSPAASRDDGPPAPVIDLADRRARREASTIRRFAPKVVGIAAAVALGMLLGRVRQSERSYDMQVAMAATPLAPNASATVKARTEAAGVRIELSAVGLPEPPPGSIYEAWVTDGTTRIPIGTFSKGGHVVLWSGVPLTRYPTITVTLEPVDGDASSSGKVVLRGTLIKR